MPCREKQNLFFYIMYSWEETGNRGWKMARLYNLKGVSRVAQHLYNPLHPLWFRSYKQTTKANTNDQSALFIVLYGRQRINWRPPSLSLIRKQQVGSEERARERHITTSSMTHASPSLCTYRAHALNTYSLYHIQPLSPSSNTRTRPPVTTQRSGEDGYTPLTDLMVFAQRQQWRVPEFVLQLWTNTLTCNVCCGCMCWRVL